MTSNATNICLFLLVVSLAIAYGQADLNATDPVITNDENGTSILLANSAPYNDSIPVKNGMLSIVEELLNWYIPDSIPANNDADVVPPMQYASTCNMLCSVGWEEDITSTVFAKRKVLRCKTVNLTKIEFDAEECDTTTGICSRVLE